MPGAGCEALCFCNLGGSGYLKVKTKSTAIATAGEKPQKRPLFPKLQAALLPGSWGGRWPLVEAALTPGSTPPAPTWGWILSRHPPSTPGKPEHAGALARKAGSPAVLCESVSAVLSQTRMSADIDAALYVAPFPFEVRIQAGCSLPRKSDPSDMEYGDGGWASRSCGHGTKTCLQLASI